MISSEKLSIFKETNGYLFLTICNSLLSMGFYGFAAHNLSIENFGIQLKFIAAAGAVIGLIDFGSSFLHLRDLASGQLSLNNFANIFMSRLLFFLFLTLPLLIIAIVSSKYDYASFLILINMQLLFQFACIPYRARGKISLFALMTSLERLFSLLILVVCIQLSVSIKLIWILICGSMASLSILIKLYSQEGIVIFKKQPTLKNPWKRTGWLGGTNAITQAQQLDYNLLAHLTDASTSATYGAVSRWTNSLSFFAATFCHSIIPIFSRDEIRISELRAVRKAALWLIISVISSCIVFLFSAQLVDIILGNSYESSKRILQTLSLASVTFVITQPCATILLSKSQVKPVFISICVGIILQMTCIVLLAPKTGSYSASLGYLVGQLVSAIILATNLIIFLKRNKVSLVNN